MITPNPWAVAAAALIVALSLPLALRVLLVSERWVARHLDQHRAQQEQRAFDEIVSHLGDVFGADDPMRHLPPAPAPLRHEIRRRRMPGVRIPGRPRVRRHTTTSSSSDRRL